MKILSWNINGLRSAIDRGFGGVPASGAFDVICLQETRTSAPVPFDGYHACYSFAQRKGYSGVAILSKGEPVSFTEGIGHELDAEGRVLTTEFPDMYLMCVYSPTSQEDCRRLPIRMQWEAALRERIRELRASKPVVLCGDLNVAPSDLDVFTPRLDGTPEYTGAERRAFAALLGCGLVDAWREQNSGARQYTWWSYQGDYRAQNRGMRLDHILVDERLYQARPMKAAILDQVGGSDHCPVAISIG